MLYLAIDGDRIGELLERLLLTEDLGGARRLSETVNFAVSVIGEALKRQGCELVFAAGDGVFAVASQDVDVAAVPLHHGVLTFSMGISDSPREALLALKVAKGLGRNQVVRR